eukprot:m.86132 g.86132  ORF g.86132 m.86132 type:complete len:391 (+) comp14453_c1_seq4:227-1399(+)
MQCSQPNKQQNSNQTSTEQGHPSKISLGMLLCFTNAASCRSGIASLIKHTTFVTSSNVNGIQAMSTHQRHSNSATEATKAIHNVLLAFIQRSARLRELCKGQVDGVVNMASGGAGIFTSCAGIDDDVICGLELANGVSILNVDLVKFLNRFARFDPSIQPRLEHANNLGRISDAAKTLNGLLLLALLGNEKDFGLGGNDSSHPDGEIAVFIVELDTAADAKWDVDGIFDVGLCIRAGIARVEDHNLILHGGLEFGKAQFLDALNLHVKEVGAMQVCQDSVGKILWGMVETSYIVLDKALFVGDGEGRVGLLLFADGRGKVGADSLTAGRAWAMGRQDLAIVWQFGKLLMQRGIHELRQVLGCGVRQQSTNQIWTAIPTNKEGITCESLDS